MSPSTIKPTHKAIQSYYDELAAYSAQNVSHETAVRSAFQNLLTETGKLRHWTLIPELSQKVGGKLIRPDGTLRDEWHLPRGYWEAKDEADDLHAEIKKKIARGYPAGNTIFEDTRTAVLYQNNGEAFRASLEDRQALADLLNHFYSYTPPNYEGFTEAVAEFKDRIPDLAKGLTAKIADAHEKNPKFQGAFDDFFELCKTSLNPNIRVEAVDEMLVQHLLTERLFRTIFKSADFTRRNVIAAEVEKVIDALTGKSFSREAFLKSLDRFYVAIETTAESIEDFSQKQHFLNTVYERFFQGYSVKVADTHGIVYTPQEIVDFMCASVEEVLRTEFGKGLGDEGVTILDPCTGTGNFIVNLLRRIPKRDLKRAYRDQLFANEVMLLPYYIAALNIEHEYYELTGEYEAFEGLCFVDTLDMAEGEQKTLSFMTAANTARVERQKRTSIRVVIANPPYNMGQVNENDDNKNRQYKHIDKRITATFSKESKATLKNKLYDPYIKFFRWAIDRLQGEDGVVCFVTNNSFVDQVAFDGMRKLLLQEFTTLKHLDLHGNVRKNPKLSGSTHNVFGIQVGVGITIAIRAKKHKTRDLFYHRVPEIWTKTRKLSWLAEHAGTHNVAWTKLEPDGRNNWLVSKYAEAYASILPIASEDGFSIFNLYSLGVATNRDEWIYDFSERSLAEKLIKQITNYNYELFRLAQEPIKPTDINAFINNDPKFLKWTDRLKWALQGGSNLKFEASKIRPAMYRPFSCCYLYFDSLLNQRRYQQHHIYPEIDSDNKVIVVTAIASEKPFMAMMLDMLTDLHLVGAGCGSQCFPFYTYDEDGTNRRENITDWALSQFRDHYKNKKITKWDIFHYVYGILHHPGYREKYADNLKRELPRVPFAPDFKAFVKAGERLGKLHLEYEALEPWPLKWVEADGVPLSYRVEKMALSKDKTTLRVNDWLTLTDIPPEVSRYRLGNRSALEWVVDQYRVTEDPRSGIRSDPNRPDDEEYIVRLIGQVVRVSVETVKIVENLPAWEASAVS